MTKTRARLQVFAATMLFALLSATVLLTIVATQKVVTAADETGDLKDFMRQKLDASSQILEGLTIEDEALIRKGAAKILEMSKVEKWNVLLDENYREFNRDFRETIRKLDKAAAAKNFDNALLQWFDATKGCIECHKHVRDVRPVLKK